MKTTSSPDGPVRAVLAYHDGTKHHFHRFARSLGYLDWASQPNPFRSFAGARELALTPRPDAVSASPSARDLGTFLRLSLGLSAWKQFRDSRWSLRVNPSSGNLHPTEAYVVGGAIDALSDAPAVYHYAPDRHALEVRCRFAAGAWAAAMAADDDAWLVALTSIHWREAWKYGERAFRYCQHDLGHAIAAVAIAADLVRREVRLLPDWSSADIAKLTGIDRDDDYVEAEREEPGGLLVVSRKSKGESIDHARLLDAVAAGEWSGRASQLSEEHVQWTFIDEVAEATRTLGYSTSVTSSSSVPSPPALPAPPALHGPRYPAALVVQRRSAVALDGRTSIEADQFFAMLQRVMPAASAPFDALWWEARIHLLLFVHRVNGVDPGAYMLVRASSALERLRAACRRSLAWEPAHVSLPLFTLAPGDCRAVAQRVSCDQAIAGDGCFSLGMIADFQSSLDAFGPAFYRHLFWESGVVGQTLYLEAEAAGVRGTGIGCFYDDPVHDLVGLSGHAFQSLYHFTLGGPIEDTRLSTETGYSWG